MPSKWRKFGVTIVAPSASACAAIKTSASRAVGGAVIHRAIERAGYDPLCVDDDHYSGGVMDRIITQIRDSKFIVADYTKNRGGVYYEAGAAFGLGIDVVNVCDVECLKEGTADRLHFDVRHLVFVPWKKDELPVFSEALCNHIIALHGRGPRTPADKA